MELQGNEYERALLFNNIIFEVLCCIEYSAGKEQNITHTCCMKKNVSQKKENNAH